MNENNRIKPFDYISDYNDTFHHCHYQLQMQLSGGKIIEQIR
jgi:hypothetical protein